MTTHLYSTNKLGLGNITSKALLGCALSIVLLLPFSVCIAQTQGRNHLQPLGTVEMNFPKPALVTPTPNITSDSASFKDTHNSTTPSLFQRSKTHHTLPATLYQDVLMIESELYGRDYASQGLSQRLARLEKSLFDQKHTGSVDSRFARIQDHMNQKQAHKNRLDQLPLVDYLEKKLFQQHYPDIALEKRVKNLESHVFGKSFENYPIDIRIKKLTYTMPIVAKGVRVSSGDDDLVVASTQKQSQRAYNNVSKHVPELTPMDVSNHGKVNQHTTLTSKGEAVSSGSYFHNINRLNSGRYLRWESLPVKIFARKGNLNETALTKSAAQAWKKAFPIEFITQDVAADIIVDWDNTQTLQANQSVTRPILHMDSGKSLRTVVLINMSVFDTFDEVEKNRILLQQLGHALGIWGHSDDPGDVMYPLSSIEHHDIPHQWLRRSGKTGTRKMNTSEAAKGVSQRDINTLTRIYQMPHIDIKKYSPYTRN